jgi:hypothetical protein
MSGYFHAPPPLRRVNRPQPENGGGARQCRYHLAGERAMDEDFSAMSDPDFLAERRRIREELEHTPEHELSPELTARYEKLDEEFLRRASLAWTQAR